MRVVRTRAELAAALADARGRTGLVPTMGNLHRGHLALVEAVRKQADFIVASIFVNPLQFGPSEDYKTYPRTFDEDCAAFADAGVDVVFAPAVQDIYPDGAEAIEQVTVPPHLADILEGASRSGHFNGVATVVKLLFDVVHPNVAAFGEKDFQQLLVIRWLVNAYSLPVAILGVPTVREPSGLALSSRNQYLTADERARAPAIYSALTAVAEAIRAGDIDWAALSAKGADALASAGLQPEYLELRNANDLSAPRAGEPLVVLTAARLGKARLIDNLRV
ncbi:MAG: pantoate--beta-alanine ligase [Xanthomonadaceae bacterium]|nr:pantoate--beta-alanine ligase [Xanthomonadaceae bacterium]